MKEIELSFIGIYSFGYYDGIGILDPTAHEYEDAYADGYVKTVFFDDKKATHPVWNKVHYTKNGDPFIRKYGKRYMLNAFIRCDCCGITLPHIYRLIK